MLADSDGGVVYAAGMVGVGYGEGMGFDEAEAGNPEVDVLAWLPFPGRVFDCYASGVSWGGAKFGVVADLRETETFSREESCVAVGEPCPAGDAVERYECNGYPDVVVGVVWDVSVN